MRQQKLLKALFKLRHLSWWMTGVSALLLVLATVNAALIFGRVDDYLYIMQGLYGSLFGIIAGPIGIRLSYVNQIHQMKRSWSAFVILCIFTTIGAIIGFLIGWMLSVASAFTLYDRLYGTNGYYTLSFILSYDIGGCFIRVQ